MAEQFSMTPRGRFELAAQRTHFGGWPAFPPDPAAVAMAFPVEGWTTSAAVILRQPDPATIAGEVHGVRGDEARRAWQQALEVLSLDVDGSGFAAVGERDPVLGRVGQAHGWLRPTLFISPYEAACNFIIGQRISGAQARALRARMATESGDSLTVDGVTLAAFPRPQALLALDAVRSLPDEKLSRLKGVAQAALDGTLDRARLRAVPTAAALAELGSIRGVGPFSAQGILFRGAGVVDEITDEEVSKQAIQRLYGLDSPPDQAAVLERAQAWRPYRMWALVLLHVWVRGEGGGVTLRSRGGRGR